ncbi:DNA polymerase III subunit alpha [Pseudomonas phage tabernarius]|uniref:DNA polymerase III subunit alpha n=1 Tax=Pseudomonas phage tabernarius TaxID=2048978 RepID=A0A2H4P6V7_9CAUD|nr:DNA polymerase [Pseudomonas phage tabernarius]ATW57916.1 DNA polymerase III subunit alpha [Pseudomonas phage tabernarius]
MTSKFPQLRVRTGFSFKAAFGRIDDVIDTLKELNADFAGLVDTGTWGAVRWEQALSKTDIKPGFGVEVPIGTFDEDGELLDSRPVAWMLATDYKGFFLASTHSAQNGPISRHTFRMFKGVVRFSGGALRQLSDDDFDYIDLNPTSGAAIAAGVARHRATGKPLVLTSYNDMPRNSDKDAAQGAGIRTSIGIRHLVSETDIRGFFSRWLTPLELDKAIENTGFVAGLVIASNADSHGLPKAPIIKVEGDLMALARAGQAYRLERGHIAEWTPEYEDRLNEEYSAIMAKGFDSYFLVVSDLIRYAKQTMLVGPGRGSSSGSLICYLTEMTEVDPIPFGLLFARFIDVSRSDLPDVDIDFPDTRRADVIDYLFQKYGNPYVSKLGNVNMMKGLSIIGKVGAGFGLNFFDTDALKATLVDYASGDDRYGHGMEDTFAQTEQGRSFAKREPYAAGVMSAIELNPSHSGVHAAGIIVCNEPVGQFCTVGADGVAQIDKPDAEYLNLLKIDVLGLRTLGVIEDAGVMTVQELYDLPLNNPEIFQMVNDDKLSGVFQFEGGAVRRTTNEVNVTRFDHLEQLTALARPGPLSSGMATKYIERVAGREDVTFPFPELEPHLSATYGVLIYQEQIMSIARDIGLLDWEQASGLRRGMAKSKGEEYLKQWYEPFLKGALSLGIKEEHVAKLWSEMAAFGAYGFNKSHAVAYGVVTYWTLYLKRYHRLEFAAASLRAAKDDEQTIAILRELAAEGVTYSAIDPELSGANWKAANGKLVGGIMNAKGFGMATSERFFALRDAAAESWKVLAAIEADKSLTEKEVKKLSRPHQKVIASYEKSAERLANAEVKFASIAEAHELFGDMYRDSSLAGVTDGRKISQIKDVAGKDTFLIIGKLTEKKLEDENDPKRQAKRIARGKRGMWRGDSQFADLFVVDDSTDQPYRVRIQPESYPKYKSLIEGAKKGQWFMFKGWRMSPTIDIFIGRAIKRLKTPKEIAAENKE